VEVSDAFGPPWKEYPYGPSGCGKTLAAQSVAEVLDGRQFFYFNVGATQDPRSTLIGNTHYSKDKGTFVAEALFVKAIQTPNAIILLDELTRGHADAWNILMTVLDENQRYLRIDEMPNTPTIKVANGVTFHSCSRPSDVGPIRFGGRDGTAEQGR
jgi:MoxR-like ATPase